MILSCPACRTQFKVAPALIGPDGRKVRCAKCSHVWRVGPDGVPVPTGQFGMKSTRSAPPLAASAPPARPEPAAETEPRPETNAEPAAKPVETAGPTSEGARQEKSGEPPVPEVPNSPEAVAGAAVRAARQARAQKGGKKFRIFLLLLCLAVVALFMAGVITGRIGLGGLSPRSQLPSTGDVAPPAPDTPKQAR